MLSVACCQFASRLFGSRLRSLWFLSLPIVVVLAIKLQPVRAPPHGPQSLTTRSAAIDSIRTSVQWAGSHWQQRLLANG
jgi:hypothetical protein